MRAVPVALSHLITGSCHTERRSSSGDLEQNCMTKGGLPAGRPPFSIRLEINSDTEFLFCSIFYMPGLPPPVRNSQKVYHMPESLGSILSYQHITLNKSNRVSGARAAGAVRGAPLTSSLADSAANVWTVLQYRPCQRPDHCAGARGSPPLSSYRPS